MLTNFCKKSLWFRPGSNWGPSACKADVITTTPRNHHSIYLNYSCLYEKTNAFSEKNYNIITINWVFNIFIFYIHFICHLSELFESFLLIIVLFTYKIKIVQILLPKIPLVKFKIRKICAQKQCLPGITVKEIIWNIFMIFLILLLLLLFLL